MRQKPTISNSRKPRKAAQADPLKRPRKRISRGKDTMTAREVAFESGLGLETIYEEIRKRRLACVKVGNRHVVSRANYERWLDALGTYAA
jgi:hypothetical protein